MMYLGNDRNIVRAAVLSALNVVASDAVYRSDRVEKVGGGSVALSGSFTGAQDSTFDVQIVDLASATPRVSAPVFVGVGNGQLVDLSAADLTAQTFTVTLEDLGSDTRKAYAPFQSATLRARSAGTPGNSITLTINATGLVSTATSYALQAELRQGVNEYVGDEWNFGAPNINLDGTIPTTAPRLRFGFDPQVYRQYRKFVNGDYTYSFSPAPLRSIERGTPVYAITGTRSVVISDGITTNTLTGIVTVYDCLQKIRDSSTLVEVDGVIVNDLQPNGQGSTELSVWTQPYIVSLVRDGTSFVQSAEIGMVLGASVPTERLVIRCANTRDPGAERWSVRGDVSGDLAEATSGIAYDASGYTFLIPAAGTDSEADRGSIRVRYVRPNWDGLTTLPLFEADRATIGAAGRAGSWVFEYQPRPDPACDVPGSMIGGPDQACLGITPTGDTPVSTASLSRRRQKLAAYVKTFIQSNTRSIPAGATSSIDQDITYIKQAAAVLAECLDALPEGVLVEPIWVASTAYLIDVIRTPITVNGYRYAVTTAGTSGASQPAFPTTVGATVADGGVTWTNIGKVPLGMWDDLLAQLETDATHLLGVGYSSSTSWPTSAAVVLGQTVLASVPSTDPGLTHPGIYFKVTVAGTTAATVPAWHTVAVVGGTIADGTATWARVAGDSATALLAIDEIYYERYISAVTEIKIAAGLAANFDDASGSDGCWRDIDTEVNWWAYLGTESYAPMFTGVYYHSSLLENSDGVDVAHSTREFGVGPRFGCPELLAHGDQITVTIENVNGIPTYQQGDTITVQSTRASPLEFGGGQTGNDTLTFSVVGSGVGRLPSYALLTTAPTAYSGTVAAWAASTAYTLGQQRRPVTRNGKRYQVTVAGTSAASEPTWPTTIGLTVVDGTVTWRCEANDANVQFEIEPSGIAFVLGDQWSWSIEAARFRWRKDAGAWSAAADIPSTAVALSDGLSAVFAPGVSPSWAAGDTWTFTAEAVNGVDNLRQPTDARFAWTASTTVTVTPAGTEPIAGVMLADHLIPSNAVITLQGSDDNFATTPMSQVIPWRAENIWHAIEGERAKYRVSINQAGSLSWLWLGEPLELEIRAGIAELGRLTKRYRLPSAVSRAGQGGTIEHEALTQTSLDELLAMLSHATEYDERRFGIVPNTAEAAAAVVIFPDQDLEVSDIMGYQPTDIAHRRLALTMQLEPTP